MIPLRRVCRTALLAVLVIGCGTTQPTPSPSLAASPSAASSRSNPPSSRAPSGSALASPSSAAPVAPFDPAGVAVNLELVADGLHAPLGAVTANDGSGRIFVVEKGGLVRIVRDGQVAPDSFLDISDSVSFGGEQGLLGLAFHPDFPDDRRFFVNYTDSNGDTVVASFEVDGSNADAADRDSQVQLLTVAQPYANHNGGAVAFGPDGYLYIALGDGGSGGDPHGNGQRLGAHLGKILRIDVDTPSGDRAYGIPPDNPFVDVGSALPEIFLLGLRNPWRLSFDRATGDLWIGDVGQNAYEEIDVARAGAAGENYGWNRMEGAHCYRPSEGCDQTGLKLPVAEYTHGVGGCTVVGGYVYRGSAQPDLAGGYLFGDYCSGFIWAIDPSSDALREPNQVADTEARISSFGEDESGELYVTDISGGQLLRVVASRG